jgi:hypothetical protein
MRNIFLKLPEETKPHGYLPKPLILRENNRMVGLIISRDPTLWQRSRLDFSRASLRKARRSAETLISLLR